MGCIYIGPIYIKRQSDSDNFLTFWYTLLTIHLSLHNWPLPCLYLRCFVLALFLGREKTQQEFPVNFLAKTLFVSASDRVWFIQLLFRLDKHIERQIWILPGRDLINHNFFKISLFSQIMKTFLSFLALPAMMDNHEHERSGLTEVTRLVSKALWVYFLKVFWVLQISWIF